MKSFIKEFKEFLAYLIVFIVLSIPVGALLYNQIWIMKGWVITVSVLIISRVIYKVCKGEKVEIDFIGHIEL